MITATVLTKNVEKSLKRTLDSLREFPEVLVLDSGSTDETVRIASSYPNVQLHTSPFLGFGPMHNYAAKLANYDWILSVDADEELSLELSHEILNEKLDPQKVYRIIRHNYFNGKHIKWCGGWHPDWVIRLYNRRQTSFSEDLVHEKVEKNNLQEHSFRFPIRHIPYPEMRDFLDKMQHYSSLFAEQNRGKEGSFFEALLHSWFAFFKSYFLKRGFLGGKEGLIISLYNGHTAFYKYLKLLESNESLSKIDDRVGVHDPGVS